MSTVDEAVKEGLKSIKDNLIKIGVKFEITDAQIEVISQGVLALINVMSKAAVKKADAAGKAAADAVTNVDQANAILKAAADSEVGK